MAGKTKILIVEDDKSTQALYGVGLPDDDFDKRFASNGEDAISVYYAWQPDIIVLDIMLPEISGYTVLREIREKACDRSTTIVMATSMARRNDVLDCARLGIQGYIVKPFRHREIAEKLLSCYQKTP